MHACWILFIGTFNYAFYHKSGQTNQVVDALNRQAKLLFIMKVELQGFDSLQHQYETDPEFAEVWQKCVQKEHIRAYHLKEGYLFHGN